MPRLPESFLTIEMLNGQTFQFHGRPGMALHVLSGRVHLAEAPRWLAEEVMQMPRYLDSGDVYTLQEEGWSTLYAAESGQLRCVGFIVPERPAWMVGLLRIGGLIRAALSRRRQQTAWVGER
ncbi:hypothetical protein [Silvimonas amylolytica]|uniref:Cyclic nucleotide-binding domain-containing protein n=1 Tax=Silvimonas amylolytica TaxID=449663 RepID=A0ABQ2PQX7_9NEIS|nr:hypothetical protein [Silvimonas amylolytica]GGP27654.1 hypothetical protein GCM10010971_34730 [Silvimonas amylolytica]